jgi:hypothetical protein
MVAAAAAVTAVLVTFIAFDSGGDGTPEGSPTPAPAPTLPPIAGTLGYITHDSNFALIEANGGNQRVLTFDGAAKLFAWSPDGSLAAVEFSTGTPTHVAGIKPEDGAIAFDIPGAAQPLWSQAGDRLVVTVGDSLVVYDTAGARHRVFERGTLPTWSPDSSSLAFVKVDSDGKGLPVIGDLATGQEHPLAAEIESADPVYPIAWHPSGTIIAYRNRIYDLTTGSTTDLPGTAVFWSPNGRTLLVAGEFVPSDNATRGLILDATQDYRQTIGLSIHPSTQDVPPQLFIQKWTEWTPDGRYLLYLDPDPGRETIRKYDTQQPVSQDWDRNIAGERPDIAESAHLASFDSRAAYGGLVATFMYQGKVWVYPLNGASLEAVAEGGYPAWRPGAGH